MRILDLGCREKKDWYVSRKHNDTIIHVDIDPKCKPDVVLDLNKTPWKPFKNNEFDMVWARNIYEHIDNPVSFVKEIHRICKNGAIVKITAPHGSTINIWSTIDHKRGMTSLTFRDIELYGFKIKKVEIRKAMKLLPGDEDSKKRSIVKRFFDNTLSFLANSNQYLCEQFWCNYVGGFNEIYGELEAIK